MSTKKKIGILGASGYTGAELLRLLLRHPKVEIVLLSGDRRAGLPIGDVFPQFAPYDLPKLVSVDDVDWAQAALDLVFCALPHATTQKVLKDLLAKAPDTKVVDLSADFRLTDPAVYAKWYGHEHHALELQKEAVYGLVEVYRREIKKARLVANPGCYTTCAQLPLIPLLKAKAIEPDEIVVDAKSGVSGAGRKASLKTSFCEIADNFSVYSVLEHRHVAEVLMVSGLDEPELSFTAHLLPIDRGILETIYVRTRNIKSAEDLLDIYLRHYQAEKFVRLYQPGSWPDLAAVNRTNFCDIGFKFDPATGRAVIVSAIDNLVKGAAGQAIQNMNLMLGCDETAGLL